MRYFYYLRLFFYITYKWDFKLALFTIIHEIKGEKKYHLNTSRLDNLKGPSIKGDNLEGAATYQGANYYLLEDVFDYLRSINANENIIDFGCGKGRVLVVSASYGFNKITGIDFAKELCDEARKNIIPVQKRFADKIFNVIHANAVDYKIENDSNVFFFFNPFDEVGMLAVAKNILKSLKEFPRETYVVYLNPLHKEIFLSACFEEIYHLESFKYVEASVLMKSET